MERPYFWLLTIALGVVLDLGHFDLTGKVLQEQNLVQLLPVLNPGPPYDQTANGATTLVNSGASDYAS